MGHGVAQAYAQEGYPITITDEFKSVLTGVKDKIKANLETLVQGKKLHQNDIEQILERITIIESLEETVRDVDFVTALMKSPERTIVTHWMNLPYLVPLMEVVPG